jgi:hypothetical protein
VFQVTCYCEIRELAERVVECLNRVSPRGHLHFFGGKVRRKLDESSDMSDLDISFDSIGRARRRSGIRYFDRFPWVG